jgi:integrase
MKMGKEHIVPLTSHVRGLLDSLQEVGNGSKWVLPGERTKGPISNNTMLYALYRMGYHSRVTMHGFRSTASTILNESNLWRPDAIERQLAHVPKDEVRSAYNAALYLDERTRMMNWYSDFLLDKAAQHSAPKPPRPELDLSDLLR